MSWPSVSVLTVEHIRPAKERTTYSPRTVHSFFGHPYPASASVPQMLPPFQWQCNLPPAELIRPSPTNPFDGPPVTAKITSLILSGLAPLPTLLLRTSSLIILYLPSVPCSSAHSQCCFLTLLAHVGPGTGNSFQLFTACFILNHFKFSRVLPPPRQSPCPLLYTGRAISSFA